MLSHGRWVLMSGIRERVHLKMLLSQPEHIRMFP
jgi:hypothetical protein